MNRVLPTLLSFCVMACSPSLGTHQLRGVGTAEALPDVIKHSRSDPGYVVFTISTDASLSGDKWNALYANASYCPYDQASPTMPAFGPFSAEAEPVELPIRQDTPGATNYLVFLPISGETYVRTPNGASRTGTYDLLRDARPVCIHLTHTTMPAATYSNIVRVDSEAISAAVAGGAGQIAE